MPGRSILVVDSDASFLSTLRGEADFQVAGDLAEAAAILEDHRIRLAAIITEAVGALRLAHLHRPGVPLFLAYRGRAPAFGDAEQGMMGIQRSLPKPLDAAAIRSAVALETEFEAVMARPEEPSPHSEDEDRAFMAVPAADALSAARSVFDLFIRTPTGKHVKLVSAGEEIARERALGYIRKGLQALYLRADAQERFVEHCERAAREMLKNPSARLETKVYQMVLHGEQTLRFLQRHGLKEIQLEHASRFVSEIQELVTQSEMRKHAVYKAFVANVAAVEHGTGTAIVASLLASSLKIQPPTASLGVAALFHDIGLMQMPAALHDEDESRMTPDQRALFRSHAAMGAQILRGVPQFDPMAAAAVEHHHQRLHGKGFPELTPGVKPTTLAELVGIADDFVRLIAQTKGDPALQPLKVMEAQIFEGFSRPVVESFRNFFFLTLL